MVSTNGTANGNGTTQRVLKAGVWAPIPAFMDANEELGESARWWLDLRGGDVGGCERIQTQWSTMGTQWSRMERG